MPTYKFECKKCCLIYEDLVDHDDSGHYKDVKCPECNSVKKSKLPTSCLAVVFKQLQGTNRSFEYTAEHNLEMAKKTRMLAEERSHMGSTPDIYNNLDDLGGSNYDPENW